jgi:predicted nucleic acid-binding protein
LEYTRVLVDTSIFIEYFRKENKRDTKLYRIKEKGYDIVTSSICYFEYMAGSKNKEFDEVLFKNIDIVDFDRQQAYIASKIFKRLKQKNTLIEFRDILISSSAIALDMPFVTLNKKHFKRIENLMLLEV